MAYGVEGDRVHGAGLHLVADLALVGFVGGFEPLVAEGFHGGVGGPAEPAVGAVAAHGEVAGGVGDAGALVGGAEHVPAAFVGRGFAGPALHQGAPVGADVIDVDAGLDHDVAHDLAEGLLIWVVGGCEEYDGFALVAAFGDEAFGEGRVAGADEGLEAGGAAHGQAWGENADAGAEQVFFVAVGCFHELLLVDGGQQGAAELRVVEGRVDVVDGDHGDGADLVVAEDANVFRFAELGEEVEEGLFDPVDLAGLKGGRGCGGVGDDAPFDAVEVDDFAAGCAVGLFLAGDVSGVLEVDGLAAADPFVFREAEGAAADVFGDLGERVGLGDAFRHDEAAVGEGQGHEGVGPGHADVEGAVVDGAHLDELGEDALAEAAALGPAHDAGDAVLAADRLAVVEEEVFAEGDAPGSAFVEEFGAFGHLELGFEGGGGVVEAVPDHQGVVAGDGGGGPDRVGVVEVALGDEAEDCRGLGYGGGGQGGGCENEGVAAGDHGRLPHFAGGFGDIEHALSLLPEAPSPNPFLSGEGFLSRV